MKITEIRIDHYLGVAYFKTDKLGKLNRITGGNGVGKSAILKAITEAFKSSGNDPNLIQIGEDKAEIAIRLDDNFLIERKITKSQNTVKVTHGDVPLEKPQTWLDTLLGAANQFNPVDFLLSKPKERRNLLLKAIPITLTVDMLVEFIKGFTKLFKDPTLDGFDFSKHGLEVLKDIQKHIYNTRAEVHIDLDRMKKSIKQDRIDIPKSLDAEKFKGFNLNAQIELRAQYDSQITAHNKDLESLDALRDQASELENEITRLENQLKQKKADLSQIESRGKILREQTDKFQSPDIDSLKREINDFQEFQKHSLKLQEIERKESEVEETAEKHKALDALYKTLTNEVPIKLLSDIKLPIKGLELVEDNIQINGVDIDKLATSEQTKFSVNIARSLAGKLKVICVDRFETLDDKSRKAFEKEAASDGFEYFITTVTDGDLKMETEDFEDKAVTKKERSKAKF